jgi:Flp pilus assembly protein TadB
VGGRLAAFLGVQEELRIRLERVHAAEDATEFRMRQVASAFGALLVSGTLLSLIGLPALAALVLAWITPLLTFLLFEQHLASRSLAWQRDLEIDAPLVAEQLAMLLDAGMSLGSSLHRIAQRSDGAVAHDLRRVTQRIRQGVGESDALEEWRAVAGVPAIDRLVAVLRFHTETSDLGRLVSDEARISREESHRRLLETMERKAQAVWIPVTVAALVPGVIFLSVPFLRALSFFSST